MGDQEKSKQYREKISGKSKQYYHDNKEERFFIIIKR